MHTEETKQKMSDSFWKSARPGGAKIPVTLVAQLKTYFNSKTRKALTPDLAKALGIHYESIRLIEKEETWARINATPISPPLGKFLRTLEIIVTSPEFYRAPRAERDDMIYELRDTGLLEVYNSNLE